MPEPETQAHERQGRSPTVEMSVDQWYQRDADWLQRLLRRNFRLQPAEADDIAQDTWLRLLRNPPRRVNHPRAFLSHIAANLFRDRKRREQVRADHRHVTVANDMEWAGPAALGEQEAEYELARIIVDLPDTYRDVFVLSRFRRMTNMDIAAHLGISVKTVEWRIGKAIDLCMRRLKD
ncbi:MULTISPECIES: RNA polymerase sigma factor [Sphingobium]|uniref:RNA polymerase sigma factor n=1 Tax=Sphingobium TaxID=165695 RepID=UPI000E772D77|nr:RNA polymerase sigma factor [Sphingobium sp. YG1]